LLGLRVRIPPGAWMSLSCECCLLSGREVSAMAQSIVYRSSAEFGVPNCDRETSHRSPLPTTAMAKNKKIIGASITTFGPLMWFRNINSLCIFRIMWNP